MYIIEGLHFVYCNLMRPRLRIQEERAKAHRIVLCEAKRRIQKKAPRGVCFAMLRIGKHLFSYAENSLIYKGRRRKKAHPKGDQKSAYSLIVREAHAPLCFFFRRRKKQHLCGDHSPSSGYNIGLFFSPSF